MATKGAALSFEMNSKSPKAFWKRWKFCFLEEVEILWRSNMARSLFLSTSMRLTL